MASAQALSKRELQVYLLVTLLACLQPASASATCHRFNYSVLGKFVCQNIFMEGYGVSNFVIVLKKLQTIVQKQILLLCQKMHPLILHRNGFLCYSAWTPNATPVFLPASVRRKIDDFLKSLHTSEGNSQLPAPPHHKEQPWLCLRKKDVY